MTTHRPSAKIYAFPAGGRPRALPVEQQSGAAVIANLASAARAAPVNKAPCNGSWYHEAAVREAELARKR